MTHGSIIGYDINAKMCQISYYNEKTQEPETVDTGIEKENNQIPLVMNYYKETWTYGRQEKDVYGKGQYLRGRDLGVCAWQ